MKEQDSKDPMDGLSKETKEAMEVRKLCVQSRTRAIFDGNSSFVCIFFLFLIPQYLQLFPLASGCKMYGSSIFEYSIHFFGVDQCFFYTNRTFLS